MTKPDLSDNNLQQVNESLFSEVITSYFSSITVCPLLFISSTMIFSSSGRSTWGTHSFRTASHTHTHTHKLINWWESLITIQESIKKKFVHGSCTHTCGGLVQAGSCAVRLNHPQYLSVLLQSGCACQTRDYQYHTYTVRSFIQQMVSHTSLGFFFKRQPQSWRANIQIELHTLHWCNERKIT